MIDMAPSLALLVLVGVLVGSGVTLVLERSLTRIVIGVSLITYGVNVLVLMAGGRAGAPPIIGQSDVSAMADPLPQAMVLTAIVIGLALTAFMLAMAYRSWQINGNDEVQDDREDRRIALAAARDAIAERVTDDSGASLDEQAASVFDETEDIPAAIQHDLHSPEATPKAINSVIRSKAGSADDPGPSRPSRGSGSGSSESTVPTESPEPPDRLRGSGDSAARGSTAESANRPAGSTGPTAPAGEDSTDPGSGGDDQ